MFSASQLLYTLTYSHSHVMLMCFSLPSFPQYYRTIVEWRVKLAFFTSAYHRITFISTVQCVGKQRRPVSCQTKQESIYRPSSHTKRCPMHLSCCRHLHKMSAQSSPPHHATCNTQTNRLQTTQLQCNISIAINCSAINCSAINCNVISALYSSAVQSIAVQSIALQLIALQLIALQLIALQLIALQLIALQLIALQLIALHLNIMRILHCNWLHCIWLQCWYCTAITSTRCIQLSWTQAAHEMNGDV